MPIQLRSENGGKQLVVHVYETVTKMDYEHLMPEMDHLIRQYGASQVMLNLCALHDWKVNVSREDIDVGVKHFIAIDRLAMVGENKWKQVMATFSKPFTKATIRYFDHANATAARQWLGESQHKA